MNLRIVRPQLVICGILMGYVAVLGQNDQDTIKFSHQFHLEEVGATCLTCHTNAEANAGKGATNHPTMESCGQCHEAQIDEQECDMCHSQVDEAHPFDVELHHKNFSHKQHLQQGVECTFCHKGLTTVDKADEENLPEMRVCWSCHDNKTAPRNCYSCHPDPKKVMPPSHRSPWFAKNRHKRDAKLDRTSCEKCHQETFCDRCHRGQLNTRVHSPNFSFTHGVEARKRGRDCRTCHEPQRFCVSCHEGRR